MAKQVCLPSINMYAQILTSYKIGCYSAVGVARKNFKVDGGILGIEQDSWAFRLYPGSHCQTGDRRKEDSSAGLLNTGDVVRIDLDMDRGMIHNMRWSSTHLFSLLTSILSSSLGRLIISVNGKQKATWKGLTGTLYPALTMCHQSGNEGYTLLRT